MKTTIRCIVILFAAISLSSSPILAASPPLIPCPAFFSAGAFTIFKCIDPDDDKLLYANSVGFISQCTDY